MGEEILMSGDIKIEKDKLYRYKSSIFVEDVDINKVLVSNNISFGEKKTINTLLVTCMMIIKLSHYLDFFVTLNQPWQLVKTLKTKLWLQRLPKLRVGTWWIDMYHLAMIIFSDIIFRFAVYCFNRYFEQCKGFFERKIKDSNLKKNIDFRVITEH